jgi:hypothetical protein
LQNCQIFIFRTEKSIILLPPVPPNKNYTTYNQPFTKHSNSIIRKKGGQGGVKKSFFGFQKMNFNNSANCGILKNRFLRTKKEQFLSTLSTLKNGIILIIRELPFPVIYLKRKTNDLIGQLIIGLGIVVVNWNQFNTVPGKY